MEFEDTMELYMKLAEKWKRRDLSDMVGGELLHIAIEIGSLDGVKSTAWPSAIKWRNGMTNKTAVELTQDNWKDYLWVGFVVLSKDSWKQNYIMQKQYFL